MQKTVRIILGLALACATFAAVVPALQLTWRHFADCPSRDVLQPDGNIRMITVIDRYEDLRQGRPLRVVASYFRANTWPPLRATIALLLFGLSGGPDAILNVAISFVFFGLLFASLAFVCLRTAGSWIAGGAVFFFTTMMLLHTGELAGYSLAAMLETQGMFFLCWVMYFLFRLYSETKNDGTATRITRIGLLLSIQGLVFTKYPYGVMFFMAAVLYELLRDGPRYISFVKSLWQEHYRGIRRVVILLAGAFIFALLVAGRLGYGGLNQKSVKYAIYAVGLFTFIDFNVYVYRARGELPERVPRAMQALYLYGFLPALIWIFLHPDRFASIIGGQFWIAKQRDSFFETLFLHVFDSRVLILVLACLAFLSFALFLYREVATGTESSDAPPWRRWATGIRRAVAHPLAAILLIAWLQFLAQEFFSPNKQDRHIYHLLPVLIMTATLWAARLPRGIFPGRMRGGPGELLAGGLLVAGGLFLALGTEGIWARRYLYHRNFCFTGTDPSLYAEARWAAGRLEAEPTVLINYMHALPPAEGRPSQASEMDLLLRMRALETGGGLRNDSRFLFENWREFSRLLVIAPFCEDPAMEAKINRRAHQAGAGLEALPAEKHPSAPLCLKKYRLKHGP